MARRSQPNNNNNNGDSEAATALRNYPPAHFTLKIDSFSTLSQIFSSKSCKVNNYESEVFEASGYKWKLSLYPNGDTERNGKDHISLYLVIVDSNDLPLGWEVKASFKFLLFDHNKEKYLTIPGGANLMQRSFCASKTEWGSAKLLPLSSFTDAAKGYLSNDKCVFGVEVFVKNYSGKVQSLTTLNGRYTWTIDKFSSLTPKLYTSNVITIGNHKWKLQLYPDGDLAAKKKSLSLYLRLVDSKSFPDQRIFAKVVLRVVDQLNGKHKALSYGNCFHASLDGWGFSSFLPLSDLRDASRGFLVNDTLIIQTEVNLISTDKNFSETVVVPKAAQLPQAKVQNEGGPKAMQPQKHRSSRCLLFPCFGF